MTLSLLVCAISSVHSQKVAFKIPSKSVSESKPDASQMPLIEILDRIEQNYNVSFAFQKKFLSGKFATYRVLLNENFETYLNEILPPLHLTFRKIENIKEKIYIISPVENSLQDSVMTEKSRDSVSSSVISNSKSLVYGSVKGAGFRGVPGVNVVLRDTNTGTVTDGDGNFSIEVPRDHAYSLVFSHVGFETKEVELNNASKLEVVLVENIQALSEVVVTALGIDRDQKALGYAVTSVEGSQLTTSGNTNTVSALYGKIPGVRIRTAPGGATSAVTMQVRGLNSLNYNAQPLYVIDGVIMRDGNERGANGVNNDDYFTDTRIRGNGILDISPTDIQNITVLKGASASALYGSDASSGVVLISTKKGAKKSGLGVDVNYQVAQEAVAFMPRYQNIYGPGYDRATNLSMGATEEGWLPVDLNGDGIPDAQRPRFQSYGQFGPKMEGQDVVWWDGSIRKYTPQPNNYENFYRKGLSSSFNVALSNRIDKWFYRISYTRMDYAGIQVGGNLGRNTLNLNTSLKASDKLKVDLMVNYSNSMVHNRPLKVNRLMSSFDGFFSRAEDMSLFFEKYKTSEGYKWVPYDQAQRNPEEALRFPAPRGFEVMNLLWEQLTNSEDELQNRMISSLTVDYGIAKNLKLRGRGGYDITNLSVEMKKHNEYPTRFNGTTSTGAYGITTGRFSVLYSDALLTYTKSFPRNFKLVSNAGFQLRDEKYFNESISTSGGLVLENWFSLNNSFNPVLNNTRSNTKILKYAFLGVTNLSYKDYLFVEVTGRQEYSSTLPPGYNSYFYPSVNTSFVFSEAFKMPSFIDFGKLRISDGVVGNAPPAYESNVVYNLSNLQTSSGSTISATSSGSLYGNNAIRPERKHETEIGLDVRMFHNKLGVDLTYYVNRTYDQILKLDVPGSAGADRVLTNVGTIGGHGWELGISATPFSKKLVWTMGINAAFNTTKLFDLSPGVDHLVIRELEGSSIRVVAEKGEAIGNIYVYPRMTDAGGNPIIGDNGLYEIDHSRYVKAGNLLPDFTGGFLNTLLYKNFNLQFNFDFSLGGQIISPALKYGMAAGQYETTLQYRDEAHGGLPYYINSSGEKITLPNHSASAPGGAKVYHDGVVLNGVKENGAANTTVIDAATYYLNTFDWGNNAWNERGAIYDNNYIKLREVMLGYTIPKSISKKLHFQTVRFSIFGRNVLYVWRTLQDLDPEATIGTNWLNQGIDESAGAATRSFGFAMKLSF